MQEWEYKWSLVRLVEVWQETGGKKVATGIWEGADKVAELGRQGWELVSVQPFVSLSAESHGRAGPAALRSPATCSSSSR